MSILDAVWGNSSEKAAASFDVLVGRIRRKLANGAWGNAIRTLRQVGYAWALALSRRA